jgi:hypothetical protein
MQCELNQQHEILLENGFEQMVTQHDVLIRKVCFFYASDLDGSTSGSLGQPLARISQIPW